MRVLRPWGHIDWLLARLVPRQWSLLSCCGSEARSVGVATHLGRHSFVDARIVTILDPDPLDSEQSSERLVIQKRRLLATGFGADEISDAGLLTTIDERLMAVQQLKSAGRSSILIDISSLPKTWFFPIVQFALADPDFEDVIVTYTSATDYASLLSENMLPLQTLPGFFGEDGRSKHDSLIVGIGFEGGGVGQLLSELESDRIRLVFPFPPGPPGHWRNWSVVRTIEQPTQRDSRRSFHRVHVNMYDCPQIFDALCKMTNNGRDKSAIGPYGPKTVSLAMCLFALAAASGDRPRVPVYYTQPTRYAIDYTGNIAVRDRVPEIVGYCLRLSGNDLYTLPHE